MQCPKDRGVALITDSLMDQLKVQRCPTCEGNWLPPDAYTSWQAQQPEVSDVTTLIDRLLEVDYTPAPTDGMASLCPACSCYLARAKVSTKTWFYVERCPNCKGIWCDRGEWEVLQTIGLHALLERLFTTDWQTLVREREQIAQERRATIEKLGPELANQIFDLAEVLAQHPNGDFGVAYLMRRFDQ